MSLRETCVCGHDKASHAVNLDDAHRTPAACLCAGCECPIYCHYATPTRVLTSGAFVLGEVVIDGGERWQVIRVLPRISRGRFAQALAKRVDA